MESANSNNSQAILKEMYASRKKIPHMADGGIVPDSGIPEGFEADATSPTQPTAAPQDGIPEGFEAAPDTAGGYATQALRGGAEGVVGPLAPLAEQQVRHTLFGTPTEQVAQEQREGRAQYPGTTAAGEVTGLTGSMLTGVGEGALALKAAEHIVPAIPTTATTLAKIGSRAASDFIANGIISGSDELSKMVMHEPDQSIGTAAVNIGLGGLIGGVIGGGIGAVSPLFQAASGKAATALQTIADHMGGIDGQIPEAANTLIERSGAELSPEAKAVISNEPGARNLSEDLLRDSSKAGTKYKAQIDNDYNSIADNFIGALGHDPETAIEPAYDKYQHGKNIGDTLASEFKETQDPLAKTFEDLKDKVSNKELTPDTEIQGPPDNSNPYDPKPGALQKVPGTISQTASKLAELSQKEGWNLSTESDITKAFNNVMKDLPGLKTVGQLSKYITRVGENTASTLPFGQQTPLSRAGAMIKTVLKGAEADATLAHLGADEGAETIAKYQAARAAYAKQAALKDYLDDYLKINGSTSGFAKGLSNMAQTEGEKIANRLSGKGSADLLDFLNKNFPKTAEAVRQMHVQEALSKAASAAKDGEKISISALRKNIESMSPELRSFIASPETLTKLDALGQVVDKLKPGVTDASWRQRTIIGGLSKLPGTVMGAATMLMGHNPAVGALIYHLSNVFAHEGEPAVKLAMLKFLSSGARIDAPAFKAALESITNTMKGESTLAKAAKNVFTANREVLAENQMPSNRDRIRLQKQIDEINNNPKLLLEGKNQVAHYMPEHGVAQAQTVSNAVSYLNSIKPATIHASPLDTPIKPYPAQIAKYNNALNIAHQPLLVLNKIKAGTATPSDIEAMQTMYPALTQRVSQRLMNEMIEAKDKGNQIPYKTRLGLSLLLGQPLDSTLSPASIIAAQPQPAPPQAGTQQGPQTPSKGKHNLTGLSKVPEQTMTQSQSLEARKNK